MRVACLGGGPAGLYLAISLKLRDPRHEVEVFERNRAGDTFGWGVVFSDQTLDNLRRNDPVSAETIVADFHHWDDIVVRREGQAVRSTGHGFIGIGRKRLLTILQERARELGVVLRFETEFGDDVADFAGYDLIAAADGINSRIRTRYADRFGVEIQERANKFVWLGTSKLFEAFEFIFEKTHAGWIWAHAYRFDETRSTFIVECSEATWRGLGFDAMDQDDARRACEAIFAGSLDGHPLISNAAHLRGSAAWINFRRVLCDHWSFDNVVLLGDAAHTAHFSIGSGTKLALEDAVKLAEALHGCADGAGLPAALKAYEDERRIEVLKIQNSARNSTEWFETIDRYTAFQPMQFAYSLLTRSQRVSHENLRLRDPAWLSAVERWFGGQAGANDDAPPPMFTPFALRGLRLRNRVAVAPILTYAADAGAATNDFHLVHYGARALGGAGLIVTEMTAVSPDGRITSACVGLYDEAHVAAWREIADFVHARSDAALCVQLGHAGARGAVRPPADGDGPVDDAWPLVSASALPWGPGAATPAQITRAQMDEVRDAFVAAARRAERAGFDMVELQAGHGYLLSSFITPLMNRRTDEYGGPIEARLRYPLEVVRAVRQAWPAHKPLAVRISADDWMGQRGITPADAVLVARALVGAGADLIDVSSGETSPEARPVFGRMYQAPLSDRIRNEAGCATMAVGNIFEPDHVNSILAGGRADLVALGRPHLADPAWTLRAAAALDYRGAQPPPAYALGQAQLARNLKRAADVLAV